MYREAFHTLEAIRLGRLDQLEGRGQWVDAFRTCRWVVETEHGFALTAAGTEAYQDLSKRYGRRLAA